SRPESRPAAGFITWQAAGVGVCLIIAHAVQLTQLPLQRWFLEPYQGVLSVVLLYCGYALMTPALVRVIAPPAVRLVAWLVGIRHGLLRDQIGRATWRSGAIACGLMVGLSLIVSIVVHS